MSSDPFEARLQFLQLLRRLTASQQSIQTVVSHAVKYGRKCGADLWDCLIEECGKGNLNARINVLYFLDSLCDPRTAIGYAPSVGGSGATQLPYTMLLNKDLVKLIDLVVPIGKEGILNVLSAKQLLESWRNKQIVDVELADNLIRSLEKRRADPNYPLLTSSSDHPTDPSISSASAPLRPDLPSTSRKRPAPPSSSFSRNDIFRRMEEDRERHKRLREKMWVLPIPGLTAASSAVVGSTIPAGGGNGGGTGTAGASPASQASPPYSNTTPRTPASPGGVTASAGGIGTSSVFAPLPATTSTSTQAYASAQVPGSSQWTGMDHEVSPVDAEFNLMWETVSDFDDDDREALEEEKTKRDRSDEMLLPSSIPSGPSKLNPTQSQPSCTKNGSSQLGQTHKRGGVELE